MVKVTLAKLLFVFVKLVEVNSMAYVPASVPLTEAVPLNVKSFSVYSVVLCPLISIEVTS